MKLFEIKRVQAQPLQRFYQVPRKVPWCGRCIAMCNTNNKEMKVLWSLDLPIDNQRTRICSACCREIPGGGGNFNRWVTGVYHLTSEITP